MRASALAGTTYDVYLVAGQSNMDGRGRAGDLTNQLSGWLQPQTNVLIYYANPKNHNATRPNYSSGWQILKPGFSVPPGFSGALPSHDFGPELSFGRTIAEANPTRHIALIKVTQGGTSLKKDWNPNGGYMYETFTNTVRVAMQALRREGNTGVLRGLIWHQGESDEAGGGALYATNLTAFIAATRHDVGEAGLSFVIGEIATNRPAELRRAQIAVSQSVPRAGFASSDGLKTYEGTHFVTADVLELGRRFAAAIGNSANRANLKNHL